MAEHGGGAAAASAASGTSGNSFLPWHLIPVFKPGETDINEYTRRLEFLLSAYVDARKRLLEKAKGRGFWGPSKAFKGKGKGKNKGGFKSNFRKPLAQRILDSTCRICHQKGHWKAECPQRHKLAGGNAPSSGLAAFAGVSMTCEDETFPEGDVLNDLPENAVAFMVNEVRTPFVPICHAHGYMFPPPKLSSSWNQEQIQSRIMKVRPDLVNRLRTICRSARNPKLICPSADNTLPDPLRQDKGERTDLTAEAFFVSHGSSGIVDLGASMSVIGNKQFHDLCSALPMSIKSRMKEAPCQVSFRFGNDSTATGRKAVFFPIGSQWIKVIVVPSNTPFLIANNVFRALGAVIDTQDNLIYFKKLNRSIPINLTDRKLYRMDFQDLLLNPNTEVKEMPGAHHAMFSQTLSEAPLVEIPGNDQPCTVSHAGTNVQQSRLEVPSPADQCSQSVLSCDHGRLQAVRCTRRSSAEDVTDRCGQSRGSRSCHEDDTQRTEPMSDRLWQDALGKEIQGHGGGDQVPHMVRRDLQAQQETQSCLISSVHSAPLGSDRRADEPCSPKECSQSQRSPQEYESPTGAGDAPRSVASSQLRGRGDDGGPLGVSESELCHRRRGGDDAQSNGQDGERLATDSEPPELQPCRKPELMTKHQIADLCAAWQSQIEPNDIFDPMSNTDVGENICLSREDNWVAHEIWNCFSQREF